MSDERNGGNTVEHLNIAFDLLNALCDALEQPDPTEADNASCAIYEVVRGHKLGE